MIVITLVSKEIEEETEEGEAEELQRRSRMEFRSYPHGVPEGRLPGDPPVQNPNRYYCILECLYLHL